MPPFKTFQFHWGIFSGPAINKINFTRVTGWAIFRHNKWAKHYPFIFSKININPCGKWSWKNNIFLRQARMVPPKIVSIDTRMFYPLNNPFSLFGGLDNR